jgi:hypothetical protein
MATTINASTSAGLVSTADTSGVLQLQTAGTTVLNAELGKALALQGATSTTGCGIAFPSTQVASSDVNTLDDYEEGTWTPADASGASLSLTVNAARYTKVGRLVTLAFFVTYPTNSNGLSVKISGAPFAGIGGYTGISSTFGTDSGLSNYNIYFDGTFIFIASNTNTYPTNANMSGKFAYSLLTYFSAT